MVEHVIVRCQRPVMAAKWSWRARQNRNLIRERLRTLAHAN